MICAYVCMYMHVDKSWKAILLAKKEQQRDILAMKVIFITVTICLSLSLYYHIWVLLKKNFRLSQAHLTNRMQNVYAERGMFHIQIPKNTQK